MPDVCFLLPGVMRKSKPVTLTRVPAQPIVEIVYIFVVNNQSYRGMAIDFLDSYKKFPPGLEHRTTIVCNGGPPKAVDVDLFNRLPNVSFLLHDNSGYDIGGYQHASAVSTSDLMLFLGASTYFNGPGWLKRVVESFVTHGDALYGTMGNLGDPGVSVNRHIRSTAFWISPKLFNQYPLNVRQLDERYQFEHRENCITEWVLKNHIDAWVVCWDQERKWPQWDDIPNGFHRGDQSNLMIGDHISRPPHYPRGSKP